MEEEIRDDGLRDDFPGERVSFLSELNETDFLESLKGRKFSENAPRKLRKHGEKASQRGISSEQVCIMTGVERNGGPAYAVTLNRVHPSVDKIKAAFQNYLSP